MTNVEQKVMIITDTDKEAAREYIKNRLFNAGLYGLSGETLYPKFKDAERFYQLLNLGIDENSQDFNYTNIFRKTYGENYKVTESNMITSFKKHCEDGLTPALLYRIIREEVLKEWGIFSYDL